MVLYAMLVSSLSSILIPSNEIFSPSPCGCDSSVRSTRPHNCANPDCPPTTLDSRPVCWGSDSRQYRLTVKEVFDPCPNLWVPDEHDYAVCAGAEDVDELQAREEHVVSLEKLNDEKKNAEENKDERDDQKLVA